MIHRVLLSSLFEMCRSIDLPAVAYLHRFQVLGPLTRYQLGGAIVLLLLLYNAVNLYRYLTVIAE